MYSYTILTYVFYLNIIIMFGAMYFIYYINRSIATKVGSTYLLTAYMSCSEWWTQTSDI